MRIKYKEVVILWRRLVHVFIKYNQLQIDHGFIAWKLRPQFKVLEAIQGVQQILPLFPKSRYNWSCEWFEQWVQRNYECHHNSLYVWVTNIKFFVNKCVCRHPSDRATTWPRICYTITEWVRILSRCWIHQWPNQCLQSMPDQTDWYQRHPWSLVHGGAQIYFKWAPWHNYRP